MASLIWLRLASTSNSWLSLTSEEDEVVFIVLIFDLIFDLMSERDKSVNCNPGKWELNQALRGLNAKLQGKIDQHDRAGQVHPAKEILRHPLLAPRNQPGHHKTPHDRARKKAGKENRKMDRLRSAGNGGKYGRPQARPKDDVHGIAQRKKGTAGKIAAGGGRGKNIQCFIFTCIPERIPGEFKHQGNACQAEDDLCDGILNEKGKPGQGDDRPGGIPHQRAELNIKSSDKSARGAASYGFRGNNPRWGAKRNCEN